MNNIATRDTCLYNVSLDEKEDGYVLKIIDKFDQDHNQTHEYKKRVTAISSYNQWVANEFKLNYDGSLKCIVDHTELEDRNFQIGDEEETTLEYLKKSRELHRNVSVYFRGNVEKVEGYIITVRNESGIIEVKDSDLQMIK